MQHLRRTSWVWLAVVLVGASCSSGSSGGGGGAFVVIPGSGTMVDENRTVNGFTRVEYSSEGALIIEQGATESLWIRTDDNLLPYLTSTVRSGTLLLRTSGNVDLQPTQPIEWHLTVVSLEDLDFGGIGSAEVADLTTNRLVLTTSGIGQTELVNLTANELVVDIGGISSVEASGSVDLQRVTLPFLGGPYEAENLQSREAHVTVNGNSDATVRVSDELFVTITSSGSVYYYGSPTVHETNTGTGQVVQLGPMPTSGLLWFAGRRSVNPVVILDPRRVASID